MEKEINIKLNKEKERLSQFFYQEFSKEDLKKENVVFSIENISKTLYPKGWNDYRLFYKKDNGEWKRTDTLKVENDKVIFKINTKDIKDKLCTSWYKPYFLKDYLNFADKNKIKNQKKGDLNYFMINEKNFYQNKKVIVFLARQHPGEIMSSFFFEKVAECINENKNKVNDFAFVFFPLVSLKGVENRNHRYTDNLDYNRSWGNENIDNILTIKKLLGDKNVVSVFDIHGDEVSKINFIRKNKLNKKIISVFQNKSNFIILDETNFLKRFIKKYLFRVSSTAIQGLTAEQYFSKKNIKSFTVELSSFFDVIDHQNEGYNFAKNIINNISLFK